MDEKLSSCDGGLWLHNYQISRTFDHGVEEVCTRCKDRQFFKHNTPSVTYLSYHIRSALQLSDKRFRREYQR